MLSNYLAEEYFEKIYNRPICSCGICNQKVDIKWRGCGNFAWKKYKCGRNTGVKIWSEQAKESRKGKNNPMYGVRFMGKDNPFFNKKHTEETKRKISETKKKRKN